MNNITKNNKQGGFLEIIIIIAIALLLMKYFNINVSTVIGWGKAFLAWFNSYFGTILK